MIIVTGSIKARPATTDEVVALSLAMCCGQEGNPVVFCTRCITIASL